MRYNHLFGLAQIGPEHNFEIDAIVSRIFDSDNFTQYKEVEARTKVPAYVVGIIHNLEASSNFKAHLHNGDPLTARTVQAPPGRPRAGDPPFTWLDSAIDALVMHELDRWTDWSVSGITYVLERYNGFGYRRNHPNVKSPYLWSFTTVYSAGRYIADHLFSDTSVSRQCGGMAALKRMIETGRVQLPAPGAPADTGEVRITPSAPVDRGGAPPRTAPPPPFPGHILRKNMKSPQVRAVQLRLSGLGINPGVVDSDFGDQTEAAVRLFQVRTDDEGGNPLEVDGIVGQKTWAALFGIAALPAVVAPPPEGSLLAQVLKVAASQLGVIEVPLGSNSGPSVSQFLSAVEPGLDHAPWCMAFVYWCFDRAAAALHVPNPAPKTAGVKRSWQLAQSMRGATVVPAADAIVDPSRVAPGMVFYIDTGQTTGHAGIVADVVGGTCNYRGQHQPRRGRRTASAYSNAPNGRSRMSAWVLLPLLDAWQCEGTVQSAVVLTTGY